jgi:hypothetical protein
LEWFEFLDGDDVNAFVLVEDALVDAALPAIGVQAPAAYAAERLFGLGAGVRAGVRHGVGV